MPPARLARRSNDYPMGQPPAKTSPTDAAPAVPAPATPQTTTSARASASTPANPTALTSAEIAAACALYDLGPIREVRPLPRGSALSPKALLATGRGVLVIKRRAPARSREHDIGFSHAIQSRLVAHGFPLPKLICARNGRTFVRVGRHAYEIFEFVRGHRFGADAASARAAGEALALYHHLLASAMDHLEAIGYPMRRPTTGLYHNTPDFDRRMTQVQLALIDPATGEVPHEAALLCARIDELYRHAADQAERLGVSTFPVQIIHGDWHPGNMLFQGSRVAAVLDHDSAGVGQRIGDIANGALQFSLRATGAPEMWPAEPDRARLRAFMGGLDSGPGGPVSEPEVAAIPWLMLQALVIEGVTPVAATGGFAGRPPLGPLLMIERKAAWLGRFAKEIVSEIG
jgi:Ser/Thr protein kinase RdoA (MazF antagonist)